MASISQLFVELKADASSFNSSIKEAASQAKEFEKTVRAASQAAEDVGLVMTAAGGAVVAAMTGMVKVSADYGESLNKMSIQTGISTENLSKLGFAAQQQEASFEALSTGLKKMSSAADNNSKSFSELGIQVRDNNGQLRPMNDILLDVADRFAWMEDGTYKSAKAVEIFGRGGIELIPTLNLGRAGLQQMGDEAQRLGLVMSGDAARAADNFNDTLAQVKDAVLGLANATADALGPALTTGAGYMRDGIVAAKDFTREHQTLTQAIYGTSGVILGAGGLLIGLSQVATLLPKVEAGLALIGVAASGAELGVAGLAAAVGVGIGSFINYEIAGTRAQKAIDSFLAATIPGHFITDQQSLADAANLAANAQEKLAAALDKAGISYDRAKLSVPEYIAQLSAQLHVVDANVVSHNDFVAAAGGFERALQANAQAATAAAEAQKKHNEAVTSLYDKVIPTSEQVSVMNDALKQLYAAGIPASLITEELGKQVDDMAHKYALAGKEVPEFINQVRMAYETEKAVALGRKDLNDQFEANQKEAFGLYTKLSDDSLDHEVKNAELVYNAHVKYSAQNDKLLTDSSGLYTTLTDDSLDHELHIQEKRVYAASHANSAIYGDFVTLGNQISGGLAAMVGEWDFKWGNLVDIVKNAGKKMLDSVISGFIDPITKSLTSIATGALFGGGSGGAGGLLGGLFGNLGSLFGGSGGTLPSGLPSNLIGNTGGGVFGDIGGFLGSTTGIATMGIGAAVAGVIGLIKSQAHHEADDLVQTIQNPFDKSFASLADMVTNEFNAGTQNQRDLLIAQVGMHELWNSVIATVETWRTAKGNSSDRNKVASQFHTTEDGLVAGWLAQVDALANALVYNNPYRDGTITDAEISALPHYKEGIDFVPNDGPAYLHRGERVVTAQDNNGGGIIQNVSVTVNCSYKMTALEVRDLCDEIAMNAHLDTGGFGTEMTKVVRNKLPGLVTA